VVNSLKDQKLIKVVNAGVPQKRHFLIDFSAVYKLSKKNSKVPKRELWSSQTGTLEFPNGNYNREPNREPIKNIEREKEATPTKKPLSPEDKKIYQAIVQDKRLPWIEPEELQELIKRTSIDAVLLALDRLMKGNKQLQNGRFGFNRKIVALIITKRHPVKRHFPTVKIPVNINGCGSDFLVLKIITGSETNFPLFCKVNMRQDLEWARRDIYS